MARALCFYLYTVSNDWNIIDHIGRAREPIIYQAVYIVNSILIFWISRLETQLDLITWLSPVVCVFRACVEESELECPRMSSVLADIGTLLLHIDTYCDCHPSWRLGLCDLAAVSAPPPLPLTHPRVWMFALCVPRLPRRRRWRPSCLATSGCCRGPARPTRLLPPWRPWAAFCPRSRASRHSSRAWGIPCMVRAGLSASNTHVCARTHVHKWSCPHLFFTWPLMLKQALEKRKTWFGFIFAAQVQDSSAVIELICASSRVFFSLLQCKLLCFVGGRWGSTDAFYSNTRSRNALIFFYLCLF